MITGIGTPFSIFWVWALNALQNSMMLRPRWPSAGPIGGDGLASPAGTCNLRNPVTFFAMTYSISGADLDGWHPPHLPRLYRTQRSTKWCAADPGSLRSRISGAPLRAAPHPGHEFQL